MTSTSPGVRRWVLACIAAATLTSTAGCTSPNTPDGPGTTIPSASVIDAPPSASESQASSPTPSVIDVPAPASAPPISLDPVAREAGDRAAIEAQWVKFWEVYTSLSRSPEPDRGVIAATVAVDDALTSTLEDAQTLSSQGLDTYGQVAHKMSWPSSVNNSNTANLADCMDQSNSGSYEIATGNKRTVGTPGNNLRGAFVRGSDGIWRVSRIFYLEDEVC